MKYLAVFITALILGYSVYPLLNPPVKEVIVKNVSGPESKSVEWQSSQNEKPSTTVEVGRPLNVKVDVQPEKKIEVPGPEIEKEILRAKLTVPEKILKDKLDIKTYMGFASFPGIGLQDSRLIKLTGSFKGKLRLNKASRTGILENITFEINQDPDKEMTKFEVIDIYDNTSLNIYQMTENSFKSVPGDENLIMLRTPDGFIVFDMKTYPSLSGKVYSLNKLKGQFVLQKSKAKSKEHQSN